MRILCLAIAVITGMFFANCEAALVLDDLSGYSNDFDFLTSSQTKVPWNNDQATISESGSPGWYWQHSASSSLTYDLGGASDPGAFALLDFSTAGDRALGSYTDEAGLGTILDVSWGLVLQNNTSQTISEVEVTFTGEQYRRATNSEDFLTFSFQTSASEITDLEPQEVLPTGWQSESELDFKAPLEPISVAGGFKFFDPPYPSETLTETLLVNLPAGYYLGLRWHDTNVAGEDAALAIDDLSLSFTIASVPEPSAFLFGGLISGIVGVSYLRKRLRG